MTSRIIAAMLTAAMIVIVIVVLWLFLMVVVAHLAGCSITVESGLEGHYTSSTQEEHPTPTPTPRADST
jgi:hypothetical protein